MKGFFIQFFAWAILVSSIVLISGSSSIAQTGTLINTRQRTTNQADDDKGKVNTLSGVSGTGNLLQLGTIWQVTECCGWTGTWTRRSGTNTFDGVWRHTNGTVVKDVVELKDWNTGTNQVTIYRASNNGTYRATYKAPEKLLVNGSASWYPASQTWSAVIR